MGQGNGLDKSAVAKVTYSDFSAYMPKHTYIFRPTGEMWTADGVNARIPKAYIEGQGDPIKASVYIDAKYPVEQITWMPGAPLDIKGRLAIDGGWVNKPDVTVFNLYRPPNVSRVPGDVSPWVEHVERLYGDDADHIISWLAHRVQRPGEKINHCLVFGGSPGIGKDTILEPVKRAVGAWNFIEITPTQLLGRFNGFLKSVVLRISEARDLGEVNRYGFYEHTKILMASPPDVLRIDEKNVKEYYVANVCGVILTTNNKTSGLYLPPDDRRHFVAWSDKLASDFSPEYWDAIYRWYEDGGYEIVAHYLHTYGLSRFNPKKSPPKTNAFWEIVASSSNPENSELAALLDDMGNPPAVTIEKLRMTAQGSFLEWLNDRKNRRHIGKRMEDCGYAVVYNPDSQQGLWRVHGSKVAVYARHELSLNQRMSAAALM